MINPFKTPNIVLVNDNNKLNENHYVLNLFKIFFSGMGAGCLLCGLIPGFLSFQRIFYTVDSNVFLILYISLLSLLAINIIGYIIISYIYNVFLNKMTIFLIPLGYLLILGFFSLNAYLFTDFNLTDTGYEVPFNVFMYIIDFVILFPIYGIYEYNLIKIVAKKLRK